MCPGGNDIDVDDTEIPWVFFQKFMLEQGEGSLMNINAKIQS